MQTACILFFILDLLRSSTFGTNTKFGGSPVIFRPISRPTWPTLCKVRQKVEDCKRSIGNIPTVLWLLLCHVAVDKICPTIHARTIYRDVEWRHYYISVDLWGCRGITDQAIRHLSDHHSNSLTTVGLGGCNNITGIQNSLVGWLVGWWVGWLVGWLGWVEKQLKVFLCANCCLIGKLVGWLVGRLAGGLVGLLVGWLVGWLVCYLFLWFNKMMG